jgi:hypothetical protein
MPPPSYGVERPCAVAQPLPDGPAIRGGPVAHAGRTTRPPVGPPSGVPFAGAGGLLAVVEPERLGGQSYAVAEASVRVWLCFAETRRKSRDSR